MCTVQCLVGGSPAAAVATVFLALCCLNLWHVCPVSGCEDEWMPDSPLSVTSQLLSAKAVAAGVEAVPRWAIVVLMRDGANDVVVLPLVVPYTTWLEKLSPSCAMALALQLLKGVSKRGRKTYWIGE